jgi:glycosyltransferase involved in cell wall biosynthesis
MNILQVNSQLSKGGGPQNYMQQVTDLLRTNGHQVSFFGIRDEQNQNSPDAIYYVQPMDLLDVAKSPSTRERLSGLSRALWSRDADQKIRALLTSRNFDLVHIHNIRYELSPSILPRVKQKGLPVVQTLHDYSLICPRGCFYSEVLGPCEKCRVYRYHKAPLSRCIKGSLIRSLYAAIELSIHRCIKVFDRNIDLFIAPSKFLRDKFIRYGIPEEKIYFLPNSVTLKPYTPQEDWGYCIYVGALRRLKGVYTLLAAAKKMPSITFMIVGDGEEYDGLKQEIADKKLSNVKLKGHLSGQALYDIVGKARMLILPSEWYENCPMVILEAYALKKPVIGARIGGIPELVENNVTGLLFEPFKVEDLVKKIESIYYMPDIVQAMGEAGRKRMEQDFNTTRHYEGLMEAYSIAKERNGRTGLNRQQ